jgi:hypothetical protein
MQFVGADAERSSNVASDGDIVGSDPPSNGLNFGESGTPLEN